MGLLFTYAMAYGGSVVALFNPYVGLLIYICFAIIRPEALWFWSVPQGNYSRIIAVALLAGWAINGFGDWRLGRAKVLVYLLLAYFGWAVLTAFPAASPERAWLWIEGQAKVILPFLVGISLINSLQRLKTLAWVILLSQGYVAYELNRSYFAGFNLLHEIGFGGMDNNCVGIALVSCVGLGGFMILALDRWWQQAVALACLAFMVHAILFSFSRGAMMGLIVLTAVAFLITPKRFKHYVYLVLGIVVTLQLAGPQVIERFTSAFADKGERDASAESRVEMWDMCVRVALDNPVVGLGPHHFPYHASSFGLKPWKEAHTTWLQLATEIGLPGVGFLLLFYLVCLARMWPLTSESAPVPDPWYRYIARMVVASTVGFMVSAQFVSLPGLEAPYYIVLLGAGALKLLSNPDLRTEAASTSDSAGPAATVDGRAEAGRSPPPECP